MKRWVFAILILLSFSVVQAKSKADGENIHIVIVNSVKDSSDVLVRHVGRISKNELSLPLMEMARNYSFNPILLEKSTGSGLEMIVKIVDVSTQQGRWSWEKKPILLIKNEVTFVENGTPLSRQDVYCLKGIRNCGPVLSRILRSEIRSFNK